MHSTDFTRTVRKRFPPIAHIYEPLGEFWRMVVLATHTPLTIVLPGPQPAAIGVIMLSGSEIGAGVIPCADVAIAKAKPAPAIILTILFLL